jgi:hypothetical protein
MRVRKYLSHWRRAALGDLTSAAFGWGAAIAALFVAAIPGLNIPQRLGLMTAGEQLPWWFSPLASAVFAVLIVAIFRMFIIAPYRAYRMLNPFKVTVLSGLLKTQYPAGQYEPQRVAVAIKNTSYLRRNDCVVHITAIDGVDNSNHAFPRFVERFSIDSGETKQISLMYRTFRRTPLNNDDAIAVAGPVSPGYGGNILRISANMSHIVSVRIGIPDNEPTDIRFKMRTDDTALCAERI